ncbi:MAG: ferric reductase-like transmembrane domain-containing protein [Desulfoplanes sp.]
MRPSINTTFVCQSTLIFTGLPLLIWNLGDLPARSVLKELLSIMTILLFFQMSGLFFWSRTNGYAVKNLKMSRLIRWHKILGYTCATIMLFHPLFLVLPRFFEAGISPAEALATILTTPTRGVLLGISAWLLLLTLVLTAVTRAHLPIPYTTWRFFHAVLAILCIALATWHVVDLGRHATLAMSACAMLLSTAGILLTIIHYISQANKHQENA